MADKLQKLRLGLVNGCTLEVVKDLTDHLHDAGILSDAEVEHIEGINQLRDKIRALVDMVKKKGDRSSEFLIQKVSERDRALSDSLGITVVHPPPIQEQNGSSSSQPVVHPLPIQEQNGSSSSQLAVRSTQEPRAPSPSQLAVPSTQDQRPPSPNQIDLHPISIQEQSGSSPSQSAVHPTSNQEQSDSGQPVEHSQSTQSDSYNSRTASCNSQVPSLEKNRAIETAKKGLKKCSDEDYKRITAQENNIYPIWNKNERKRLALIICNIKFECKSFGERKGAKYDELGMQHLLRELGYKVQVKENLSVEEMQETLTKFSKEEDHKTSDSTFIVIMSHGLRDCICGKDTKLEKDKPDKALQVDEIFKTFNNENCPALLDKPKVIIIQACRGVEKSRVLVSDGVSAPSSDDNKHLKDGAKEQKILREHDFVCFYSTTPDTESYRDTSSGSLFIQDLIEQIQKDAYRYPLQDIFLNVQAAFKNKPQMPTLERTTLLKKFYLFPGL